MLPAAIQRLIERLSLCFGKSAEYYRHLGVTIGEDFQSERVLWGSEPYLITIGDHVKIAERVQFITHDGGVFVLRNAYQDMRTADVFGKISVGNNVFIGNNVTILPNSKIGSNVVIGACSVVTGEIPDNTVAAGIPCRVLYSLEHYYEKKKPLSLPTKGMKTTEKKKYLLQNCQSESERP